MIRNTNAKKIKYPSSSGATEKENKNMTRKKKKKKGKSVKENKPCHSIITKYPNKSIYPIGQSKYIRKQWQNGKQKHNKSSF